MHVHNPQAVCSIIHMHIYKRFSKSAVNTSTFIIEMTANVITVFQCVHSYTFLFSGFCLLDWSVLAVTICDGVPSPTDVLAVT